jgi:hypothetical protein
MALSVESLCLQEYYSDMMGPQQEQDNKDNELTWYIFYSEKEGREYYYEPKTKSATWVLPAEAKLHPPDDGDDTDTLEASPRESAPSGFSDVVDDDENDDSVLDEMMSKPSTSCLARCASFFISPKLGMVILIINVLLSSNWLGLIVSPPFSTGIVVVEMPVVERFLPMMQDATSPIFEKETIPVVGQVAVFTTTESERVREAVQSASQTTNSILERIKEKVATSGYLIELQEEHSVSQNGGNPAKCFLLSHIFTLKCREAFAPNV